MRTLERLKKLCDWTYDTVCRGRVMKAPAPNQDITVFASQEPRVFLGFTPTRPDTTGMPEGVDPANVAPGIIIMPTQGFAKNQEEQRFDRYSGVHRPKSMGQSVNAQVLFMVYEDGVRLPGFTDTARAGAYDMDLIMEGTQEGLGTLFNWMDDFMTALLSVKTIPGTDMMLNEAEMQYGLYSDQKYISDRRPVYIGVISVTFQCHADEYNDQVNNLLL